MPQKIIKIESISKKYSDISGYTIQLFENISFDIESDKITTLLAPKGTGKSTLLKMIAGIDEDSKIPDEKRVYIPTKPSSFPWLNVRENIIFNLKNVDDNDLKSIVKFVGLDGYEDHFPNNNSIGFRFRISLARAIINNPELILIDESISNLQLKRKFELYSLLRKVTSEKGIPILYSTSLVSEAIRLSDKIILMNQLPSKIISEKTILIDEETRADEKMTFNISDYFSEEEISILSNRII
ncbi:MAG: ATP-binding cassette domain-containing protein [Melioribacteraceae bacterium]|nr:ATP-binding cassette domain-containing protein [Melioribacteraceae bacterium]